MSEKRKVLIVENQQFQFKEIVRNLRSKYFIFPEVVIDEQCENFIKFIDHVRVWVNQEYKVDYREKAFRYIEKYIESNEIELIVMDHILGGAHHCQTGIDLAKELNKKRRKNDKDILPVLFLSKTEYNKESRVTGFDNYKTEFINSSRWVHKGFFGDEILEFKYIKNRVLPQIEELLEKTEEQIFKDDLNIVKGLSFPSSYNTIEIDNRTYTIKGLLNKIEGIPFSKLSDELINMIYKVADSRDHNDLDVNILRRHFEKYSS